MKVSLITPTYQRSDTFLIRCYEVFKSQTYSNLELLILEDSSTPSTFLSHLSDRRVRYQFSGRRIPLGEKRNQLVTAATGDLIIHLDDDDYYSPYYVETIVERLENNDFLTLSGWYNYVQSYQEFYYWDTETVHQQHFKVNSHHPKQIIEMAEIPEAEKQAWSLSNLWGYGFSYGYRKTVWEQIRFNSTMNGGEDFDFVKRLFQNGSFKTSYFPDQEGLVLHIIHSGNTSSIFPQYKLPNFLLTPLFGDTVLQFL